MKFNLCNGLCDMRFKCKNGSICNPIPKGDNQFIECNHCNIIPPTKVEGLIMSKTFENKKFKMEVFKKGSFCIEVKEPYLSKTDWMPKEMNDFIDAYIS